MKIEPSSRWNDFLIPFGRNARRDGFTLIEVVLALAIAIGMLLVALYFYRQAAQLRGQVLEETERVAEVRLMMDRITADLRTARWHEVLQEGLVGGSDYIQFVKTDVPSAAAWEQNEFDPRPRRVESDLKEAGYYLGGSEVGSNAPPGLVRWEEPLLETYVPEADSKEAVDATEPVLYQPPPRAPSETASQVRYARFRYWDGFVWWDTWEGGELPLGVEVSLGAEPFQPEMGDDGTLPEYPHEVFRRVIYLPGSRDAVDLDLLFGGVSPAAQAEPGSVPGEEEGGARSKRRTVPGPAGGPLQLSRQP
jgi:prepilin-type N-terminal cleavage/methylation domain-containing protein